ncbi:MAG: trypsin-like peptidase domain-containing protein [Elusimicrobiaceae bacterium]|nr:trypsin-like peptidase domain-containing protein [Elusimicrobiaceae bacterium]
MKKIVFALLLIPTLFSLPVDAHRKISLKKMRFQAKRFQERATRQLHDKMTRLQHQLMKPVGVTPRQVERAVFEASRHEPSSLTLKASKAMIPLRERHRTMRYFRVKGTAFAVEEMYKGKRYVWGVTATHYGYQFPAIPKKRFVYEPISFRAQGNRHANDVSIFSIPESLADAFKPLKLADHSPEVGERLFSLSFFDNQFQYTPRRKVLETAPLRFTTSLKIEPGMDREGECGSPLLNHNGEVVGMVIGASYTKEIGFATTVENIRQIIQAYHQREEALSSALAKSPLLVNGKKILDLDVTEAITQVSAKHFDNSILEKSTYHKQTDLDYAHLENFIDLSQAKEISLVIEKSPFVNKGEAAEPEYRRVTYDLQTQQLTTSPFP